jgi:hypothetical protein
VVLAKSNRARKRAHAARFRGEWCGGGGWCWPRATVLENEHTRLVFEGSGGGGGGWCCPRATALENELRELVFESGGGGRTTLENEPRVLVFEGSGVVVLTG